jgi:hypothetical protein
MVTASVGVDASIATRAFTQAAQLAYEGDNGPEIADRIERFKSRA